MRYSWKEEKQVIQNKKESKKIIGTHIVFGKNIRFMFSPQHKTLAPCSLYQNILALVN